jgi:hypothetical protein
MATASEVKAGLDDIARFIRDRRATILRVKNDGQAVSIALAALPTDFADLIASIQAYGTSNAFEANAKAELAKLTTEFTALKAIADAIGAVTP